MKMYTIKPALERASIEDYVGLFRSSFADSKFSADYLRWQYLENPHGRVIGMDAFNGDELVAHYAIIPRRYALASKTFRAALSVNTATHPDHQGPQGLFFRLAKATYKSAEESGVQFIVGAANAKSFRGFTRILNFRSLGHIRLYASLGAVPPKTDALDVSMDADWASWRFRNPARNYSVAGRSCVQLSTVVKGVPFHLANVPHEAVGCLPDLRKGLRFMPGLTPYFGPEAPSFGQLPLRFQPSPWHVIWKALDSGLAPDLPAKLRLDGLGMDTF
jgi:hypothetical protein